jgi:uncharacterized protein
MGIEVRPLGVSCNIQCQYCYQNPERDAGNEVREYDLDRMKAAIEQEGGPFSMFGGEPLLVPEDDLEELFRWGFERFGRNNIQTNGSLINGHHMEMFKRYSVHVGISIDGPGELNDARWAGSLAATRKRTARSEQAIVDLCHAGLSPSLIITLHRLNAVEGRLQLLLEWVRQLAELGVGSIRLHLLEVENAAVRLKYSLSDAENLTALLSFSRLEEELPTMSFDLFQDMRRMLIGLDHKTTCIWNGCDPYTTRAVRGVEGNGQRTNCGRTNKDGIDFAKSDEPGFERYLALYQTPQEVGGCQGCRFFLMCKGQCPGTSIDGDWRNRTEHCAVWKALYEVFEREVTDVGLIPISLHPIRARLEAAFLAVWTAGGHPSMNQLLRFRDRTPPSDEKHHAAPAIHIA